MAHCNHNGPIGSAADRVLTTPAPWTVRQRVDTAIRKLWLALRDLSDTAEMLDTDLDLFASVSKHPGVQGLLESAKLAKPSEPVPNPPRPPDEWMAEHAKGFCLTGECRMPKDGERWITVDKSGPRLVEDGCPSSFVDLTSYSGHRWIVEPISENLSAAAGAKFCGICGHLEGKYCLTPCDDAHSSWTPDNKTLKSMVLPQHVKGETVTQADKLPPGCRLETDGTAFRVVTDSPRVIAHSSNKEYAIAKAKSFAEVESKWKEVKG